MMGGNTPYRSAEEHKAADPDSYEPLLYITDVRAELAGRLRRVNPWRPPPGSTDLVDPLYRREEPIVSNTETVPVVAETRTPGDGIVKLWEACNEYCMARGGGVFQFEEFEKLVEHNFRLVGKPKSADTHGPSTPTAELRTFSLNGMVRVRLTDHGRALLRAADRQPPEEDADGWSQWQLWDLMSAFGQHIYMGCREPFKTTIRLEDG